jgi:N-methylhydantoinase A/oxoprolinase/acetone carboxylase beta subunit
VESLPASLVNAGLRRIHGMLEDGVDRMRSDPAEVPLIAVGGACFLLPGRLAGISKVINVPHHGVANAVGAAIAQVSGEVDQVFQDLPRDTAIGEARRLAAERAVSAGADPATLEVVEVEDLPIAYLPGNSMRVRVRVVGDVSPAS